MMKKLVLAFLLAVSGCNGRNDTPYVNPNSEQAKLANCSAITQTPALKSGDSVLVFGRRSGRVSAVFSDGNATVNYTAFDGNTQEAAFKISEIAKEVPCISGANGGIYPGASILDDGFQEGTALAVFSDGTVEYNDNNYHTIYGTADKIGRSTSCVDNVCVGKDVLVLGSDAGHVQSVFTSKYARIGFGDYRSSLVALKDIGVKQ